jgi:hypothetical protein
MHYTDELVKDGFDDVTSGSLNGRCFLVHKQLSLSKYLTVTAGAPTHVCSSFCRSNDPYGLFPLFLYHLIPSLC